MKSIRILLLEAESNDAHLIKEMLSSLKTRWELQWVKDRKEYLNALENNAFEIILSESNIPALNASEAFHIALEKRPHAVFIFISNHISGDVATDLLRKGVCDCISKEYIWKLPQMIPQCLHLHPEVAIVYQGMKRLVDVVKELSLANSIDTITTVVRKAAREIIGADGATLVLRDGNQCYYMDEDAIHPLWKGQRFPIDACISGWCMLNKKEVRIRDVYQDERITAADFSPTFIKSLAIVPIRQEHPIGAIESYWAEPHTPTHQEMHLLQALADVTSSAFEKVGVLDSLEERVKERTHVLQALNEELDAFSYTVSHDLKSPLTAIKNNCYILNRNFADKLDDKGRQCLNAVDKSVISMREQLDAMLAMFKETQLPMSLKHVDLSEIAHDVIQDLQSEPDEASVEIVIAPNISVLGEKCLLRVVLENLLGNAWKYTGKNIGKRYIEFGQLDKKENDFSTYFVKDNGAGFDSDNAKDLFLPFQRLHLAEDFEGSGIGLSSVKRIVRKHGGEIWAKSKPGEGASFYFTIPTRVPCLVTEEGLEESTTAQEKNIEPLPSSKDTNAKLLLPLH